MEVEFKDNEGKTHKAKVRKVTFGEKNQIEDAAIDIQMVGTRQVTKIRSAAMKETAILKSVTCETHPLDHVLKIRTLTQEAGNILWNAFEKENNISNFQDESQSNTQ